MMDIQVDIHHHFWICMDVDIMNIQVDIQQLDIHVHSWISTWISNFANNAIGDPHILVDIQSGYPL